MNDKRYEAQVQLLLRILPHVAAEDCFALKGGTAINLFVRDLPRLSVDIDLTYVPIDEREASLIAIFAALGRIRARVMKAIPGIRIPAASHVGGESKLVCLRGGANVKIEVNTTLRGVLWPTRELTVSGVVEDAFGYSATIQVVSHAELFGGKIAAALDRQHPRDLFDLWQLYEHEGLTDEVFRGFLVALISHGRPMHELLAPNLLEQQSVFTTQFEGMTRLPFSYEDFVVTRARLLTEGRSDVRRHAHTLCDRSGRPGGSPEVQCVLYSGRGALCAGRRNYGNRGNDGSVYDAGECRRLCAM
jgi:hypothetical protein